MKVSRREFVTTAGCAAASSLCALPSSAFATRVGVGPKSEIRGTLLDLESNCALVESLRGMRAALGSSRRCITASRLLSNETSGILVVAAAGSAKPEIFRAVAELLGRGATVVWESGAAFLNAADFGEQQALAKEHFGISIGDPVEVWPQTQSRKSKFGATIPNARTARALGQEQIPYIEYRWPHEARVRDFSRVLPVSDSNGRAIAHWKTVPVASRTRVGNGTLVFIGSPLGPAIHAGDSEAHRLFHSLIS